MTATEKYYVQVIGKGVWGPYTLPVALTVAEGLCYEFGANQSIADILPGNPHADDVEYYPTHTVHLTAGGRVSIFDCASGKRSHHSRAI